MAAVTAGQAAEAMICNRLTSPAPLVHVGGWARTWAAEEIPGIVPASLNDDKPGRTLDAIAPHLDQITSAVAVAAITTFDIGISQLHQDMTSFSLHGAYDETDEDYPGPRYGHPKDRRPDLLQVQAGIAASGDGGIPACHRACVERRYGNLKGPLAVAPMFLHSNRRIAALITVISLALLVFCLIEREARRNLAPQTKLDGLYNRQPARPTGGLILTTLASLCLIPATATTPAQVTRPNTVQARLLELLGVDPTHPP